MATLPEKAFNTGVATVKKRKTALRVAPKVDKADASTDIFAAYFPIGEAIAVLFHPLVEVVLHDLRSRRIVRIWNCRTDRRAGDLSQLNRPEDQFAESQTILGPYEKALPSQGRTKSITAGLRDGDGKLIGLLCINLDVTLIDQATAMLSGFAAAQMKRPEPIYRNDLPLHINYLVRDYSIRVNKPIDHLTKEERVELVAIVDRAGLFQARKSVELMANAMRISRASVYNLLADSNRSTQARSKAPVVKGRKHGKAGVGSTEPTRVRE
jgi:predicted transcriptional regulator YheO